jgi:hypothetical protein
MFGKRYVIRVTSTRKYFLYFFVYHRHPWKHDILLMKLHSIQDKAKRASRNEMPSFGYLEYHLFPLLSLI